MAEIIANRYRVLEEIGSGGMGVVYRVEDRITHMHLAVKRLRYQLGDPQPGYGVGSRLEYNALAEEFQTLSALRHPNIVTVLDYGLDDERRPYFTMDYLDAPLDVRAASVGLDIQAQTRLLLQVLQALVYLHQCHILHRDIKPGNILVVNGDEVRLVDFGLAARLRQVRQGFSTLAYVAPEVLRQQPMTAASDLYSLGLVAYEMMTGKFPYTTETVGKLVYQILEQPVTVAPTLPEPLRDVFVQWLAKDPAERYGDARTVMEALCAATGVDLPPETLAVRASFLRAARFVGRQQELDTLCEALDDGRLGSGSGWLVGGVSGIGKSRLLSELSTTALLSTYRVIRVNAPEIDADPYALLPDLLRSLLVQTDLQPLEVSVLKAMLPVLANLLPTDIAPAPDLGPDQNQARLWEVISDILRRQTVPLLILLEDIHRAQASLPLIGKLAALAEDREIVVVGSYRQEDAPDLPQQLPDMQTIMLSPLSREDVRRLIDHMLGEANITDTFVDAVTTYAEGNVFFIVDLLQTLSERTDTLPAVGRIALEPERLLSPGVIEIAQRRLQQVPARYWDALTLAAALGREIDLRLLGHFDGELAADEQWLALGASRAILMRQDARWLFAHDKVRAGILSHLPEAARRGVHELAARTIEAVYPDDPTWYARLMVHWREADDAEKEVAYALLLAKSKITDSSYQSLPALLDEILQRRGQQISPRQRAYLLLRSAQAGQLLSTFDRATSLYEQALQELALDDDPFVRAEVYSGLASVNLGQDRYEEAIADIEKAEAVYQALGDAHGLWKSKRTLGNIYYTQHRYDEAMTFYQEALVLAEQLDNPHPQIGTRGNIANVLLWQKRLDEAEALCLAQVPLAEAIQNWHTLSRLYNTLTIINQEKGRLDQAQTYGDQAIEIARRIMDRALERTMLSNLGSIAAAYGDNAASETYFMEAAALSRHLNTPRSLATSLGAVAQVQVLLRKWDAVRASLSEWAQAIIQMGLARPYLHGLYALIDLALHDESPEVAARWYGALRENAIPMHRDPAELDRLYQQLAAMLPADDLEARIADGATSDLDTILLEIERYLSGG